MLNWIPISTKDALIVSINSTRDILDVIHDLAADVVRSIIVSDDALITVLAKSRDLWHITIVENIQGLWYDVHRSLLRQACCVRVTDQRGLKVEATIFDDSVREGGDIMPGVALSSDVELLILECWELFPHLSHEVNKLGRDITHVIQQGRACGKTCADRLVDVDDGTDIDPRLWGGVHIECFCFNVFLEPER